MLAPSLSRRPAFGASANALAAGVLVGSACGGTEGPDPLAGSGGASSESSSSPSSSSSGSSSDGASSSGSGGACAPGSTQSCYEGPPDTLDVGTCVAGTQTCTDDGVGFGPCVGQVLPTAEDCGNPKDTNCDGVEPACGWTVVASSTGNSRAIALAPTPSGVVVTGMFEGTMTFGGAQVTSNGGNDHFVVSLDATGNAIWATSWGSSENDDAWPALSPLDAAKQVAVLPSGDLVVATTYGGAMQVGAFPVGFGEFFDVVVVILSGTTGMPIAVKAFPAPDVQVVRGVGVSASGEIVLSGMQVGTVDWGGGPLTALGSEMFVVRMNPDLSLVSASLLGTPGSGYAVTAVDSNGMVVAGALEGTDDWGTGPLVSNGARDALTVRYDGSGAVLWARHDGDVGHQWGSAVALDAAGGVLEAGYFEGILDFGNGVPAFMYMGDGYVVRFDAGGLATWATRFKAQFDNVTMKGLADAQGDTIVVGQGGEQLEAGGLTVDLGTTGPDQGFAARLDPTGAPIWLKNVTNGAAGTGCAVAVGQSGAIFIAGSADLEAFVTMLPP